MSSQSLFARVLIVAMVVAVSIVQAHDGDHKMNEEMKAWMSYMTPGESHKAMQMHEGRFTTKMMSWEHPGAEATESQGTCENSMILGGRYMKSVYSGTVMQMPFEGIGMQGYDNAKKKYVSIWIDNMGTGIAWSEGSYDAKSKMLKMSGMMTDPTTNGDMPFRSVVEMKGKDSYVMEMFTKKNGQEFKMLRIEYTRA